MCTRIFWGKAPSGPDINIAGRVMDGVDWLRGCKRQEAGTDLWLFPPGMKRRGGGGKPVEWKSCYSSLVAVPWWQENGNQRGVVTDGINEHGLAAHSFQLGGAKYPPAGPNQSTLCTAWWAQYCLDRFKTVKEVTACFKGPENHTAGNDDIALIDWQRSIDWGDGRKLTSEQAQLQLTVEDENGGFAVIEFQENGERHTHKNEFPVVTGSLSCAAMKKQRNWFSECIRLYKNLPNQTWNPENAEERFHRTQFFLENLPKPDSGAEALGYLLSVLRNASMPFGLPDKNDIRRVVLPTWWRSLVDLDHRTYYFETTMSPNLFWVEFDNAKLAKGQRPRKLDVTSRALDLSGEVSGEFREDTPVLLDWIGQYSGHLAA